MYCYVFLSIARFGPLKRFTRLTGGKRDSLNIEETMFRCHSIFKNDVRICILLYIPDNYYLNYYIEAFELKLISLYVFPIFEKV